MGAFIWARILPTQRPELLVAFLVVHQFVNIVHGSRSLSKIGLDHSRWFRCRDRDVIKTQDEPFLFVGLSSIRSTRREIPLLDSKVRLVTGIAVVEKASGAIRGWLELPDSVAEVLDFDLVPGFLRLLIQDIDEAGGGYCAVETPVNGFWTPIEAPFRGEG